MQKPAGGTGDRAELRRRAEQRLEERRQQSSSSPDPQRLVQELQVHQFELEIQNEELQRARDDLETLLGRYQDLYDFAPVGYFSLAADGTILEANLAGAALLELERARLGGRGFVEFVPLERRAALAVWLSDACAGPSKRTCEAELQAASQRRFEVHLEAVGSADGRACRVAVVDTSDRRRIEAALAASEARYRLLFESSQAGLLLLDAGSGEVLAANEEFCRLLGDPPEAFVGRALWEIEQFLPVAGSRPAFIELQGQGGVRNEHLSMEADDGRHVDVALFSRTYQVDGGHIMQLSVRDIGERLRSERELRAMQEQLQASQKREAVGRLAGGVAHEFNNDLGVIIGHADLLRRGLPAEGPARHRLDLIEQAARHSAGLTHQLLAYARKQVLQPRRLSPSAVIAELRPLLVPLLGPGVELALRLRAEGFVRVDPKQFEEAVAALVAKACGSLPEGGALAVETADVDVSCVGGEAPEGLERGRYVTISLSDIGGVLDATARARLFDPFPSLLPLPGDTGLNLAAVYGTIKQSGGHVFVESRLGQGTGLTIYLPREE